MLEWLGRRHNDKSAFAAGGRIREAVRTILADGRDLTADLGGKATTAGRTRA